MSFLTSYLVRCAGHACAILAFAAAGLAHRDAGTRPDAELLAYVAAGGMLADICGDPVDGHDTGGACETCRLVGAVLMPDRAHPPALARNWRMARMDRPVSDPAPRMSFDLARAARAPPAA